MVNNSSNDNEKFDSIRELVIRMKWWFLAAIVVIIVVIAAIIGTHREPVQQAKTSSAYVISDEDAKQIKKLVKDVVIDCGTWGDDTSKVNKDNADAFYPNAVKYALNESRLSGEQVSYAVSRWDRRQLCKLDYVSDMSPIQNETPTPSQRDAMMAYTIVSNDVTISNPKDSKLYINNNSRSSLTVKASWTSLESGLYQVFNAKISPKAEGAGDVSLTPAGWDNFSKEHVFKDIEFTVEKYDGKWKLVKIEGDNWTKEGYVNALADVVDSTDGAERIPTPSEEKQQMPAGSDATNQKKENNNSSTDSNTTSSSANSNASTTDSNTSSNTNANTSTESTNN